MLYKFQYFFAKLRKEKGVVVKDLMDHLERDGFRFVHKVGGLWHPAPPAKARAKVIQALREFAFDLRKDMAAPASPNSPVALCTEYSTPGDGVSVVSMDSTEDSLDIPSAHSSSSYDSLDFPEPTSPEDLDPLPLSGEPLGDNTAYLDNVLQLWDLWEL